LGDKVYIRRTVREAKRRGGLVNAGRLGKRKQEGGVRPSEQRKGSRVYLGHNKKRVGRVEGKRKLKRP